MVPPSANELRRKYRTVFAYRDLRIAWENALKICTGGSQAAEAFITQAFDVRYDDRRLKVEVTVHRPKVLDDDNLMAGLKPCLDALVQNGFIRGDSPDCIEVPLPKIVLSRKRKTVIEITPCPTE